RCDQLSGGQQQRVALARTLAQNPDVILADEPIASLDPVTSKMVMDDFKRINQETNMSVLLNIHNVEVALEYADRIIGIRKGQIVYDGPTKEVTQEVLDDIYNGKVEEMNPSKEETEIGRASCREKMEKKEGEREVKVKNEGKQRHTDN